MSRSGRMKVLLIGGTGPTGPAIARGLETRGHEPTVLAFLDEHVLGTSFERPELL